MKNVILFLIIIVGCLNIEAQELSFYISSGLSGKNYTLEKGTSNSNLGANLGVSYTIPLIGNFNALIGAEFGIYQDEKLLDNGNYKTNLVDDRGSAFEFRQSIKSFNETDNFTSVNVPMLFQYKSEERFPFYVNFGAKLLFPISRQIEFSANNINLSGYYSNYNILIDDFPQHGFGNIKHLSETFKKEMKTSIALSIELGTFFKVSENNNKVYLGAFLDYGLTSPVKDVVKTTTIVDESLIITYNPDGIDKVKLNNFNQVFNEVSKAKMISFGLQLRYAFGLSRFQRIRFKRVFNQGCF